MALTARTWTQLGEFGVRERRAGPVAVECCVSKIERLDYNEGLIPKDEL